MPPSVVTLWALLILTVGVDAAKRVELLRSIGGLPAHVAGAFISPIGFQQAGSDSDARHLCAGTARGCIRTNSYGLSVRSRLGPIVCPFTLAARRKVLAACRT